MSSIVDSRGADRQSGHLHVEHEFRENVTRESPTPPAARSSHSSLPPSARCPNV